MQILIQPIIISFHAGGLNIPITRQIARVDQKLCQTTCSLQETNPILNKDIFKSKVNDRGKHTIIILI